MTHKSEENSSFEVLDVFFGGMKTYPVALTWRPRDKQTAIFNVRNKNFISAVNLFQVSVIKTLDLDPDPN